MFGNKVAAGGVRKNKVDLIFDIIIGTFLAVVRVIGNIGALRHFDIIDYDRRVVVMRASDQLEFVQERPFFRRMRI